MNSRVQRTIFGAALLFGANACVSAASAAITFTSIDHPLAGQGGTTPYDVDAARIVGTYVDAAGVRHAFTYDGATWTTLDHPDAAPPLGTEAYGVSDGLVVGSYMTPAGRTLGFLYDGTTFTTLDRPPLLPGPVDTFARGVSGPTVVGYSIESLLARGFVYSGGVFNDLLVPGSVGVFPDDIDGGRVVGSFDDPLGTHGFIAAGNLITTVDHPLGQQFGTFLTGVSGPNIVGNYVSFEDGAGHGFLYDGTQFIPVDFPGATDTTVNGIDGERIVGAYKDAAGATHGFVAVVPEPATSLTSGVLLGGFFLRRRPPRR
jgi:hypothetical protein